MDRVTRVQELRRSNAATPVPGRRFDGPEVSEWDAEDDRVDDAGRWADVVAVCRWAYEFGCTDETCYCDGDGADA